MDIDEPHRKQSFALRYLNSIQGLTSGQRIFSLVWIAVLLCSLLVLSAKSLQSAGMTWVISAFIVASTLLFFAGRLPLASFDLASAANWRSVAKSFGVIWAFYLLWLPLRNLWANNSPERGYDQYAAVLGQLASFSPESVFPNQFALDRVAEFPSLLLFVPIYLLSDAFSLNSGTILVLLHGLLLTSAVIPVFRIARSQLGEGLAPYSIAAGYLLSPALASLLGLLFHPLSVASAALAWWFYFLVSGNRRGVRIAALVSLACGQDIAVVVLTVAVLKSLVQWPSLESWKRMRFTVCAAVVALAVYHSAWHAFLVRPAQSDPTGAQLSRILPVESLFGPASAVQHFSEHPTQVLRRFDDQTGLQVVAFIVLPLLAVPITGGASLALVPMAVIFGATRSGAALQFFYLLPSLFCLLPCGINRCALLLRIGGAGVMRFIGFPAERFRPAVLIFLPILGLLASDRFGVLNPGHVLRACRVASCQAMDELPPEAIARISEVVRPDELLIVPERWSPFFSRQLVKLDPGRAAPWVEKMRRGHLPRAGFVLLDRMNTYEPGEGLAIRRIKRSFPLRCELVRADIQLCRQFPDLKE